MSDGIITMHDMEVIFGVTDAAGIDREAVRVELGREDPGTINKAAGGMLEITVPETGTIEDFAGRLKGELLALGYAMEE
ncbi:MAG: hypothetical protein FJ316_12835 [SAR202 cluster bacterium]|nr:hypothetical protein [SAR202 cluster bacterium]